MRNLFASLSHRLPRIVGALALLLLTLRPALSQTSNVVGWGGNGNGQLGNGSKSSAAAKPVFALTGTTVSAIAAGDAHTVVVKPDGTVWAWGWNYRGQLGDGTVSDRRTPVQVQGPNGAGFLTGVTAIAAGHFHTVALKQDGTVWTWGDNHNDELGDGTGITRTTPVQVLEANRVGFLASVTAIAAGYNRTFAVKQDGTVWAWGYNLDGLLGDGTKKQRSVPVQVLGPNRAGFLTGITAIAAGYEHAVALKQDGTVWTWGLNSSGQLGNGSGGDSTTPVQVKGQNGTGVLTGVIAIAAGDSHNVALKSDGTVWTWGWNGYGQLGDGTTTNRTTPVQVKGPNGTGFLTGVIAIAAGNSHTVALNAPLAVVSGVVTLQDCANPQQPVTFIFRQTNGSTPFTRAQTLGANGLFAFNDIPNGAYNVAIKGAIWLQKVVAVDATGGSVSNVSVTLPAGDGNGDNVVDVGDFGLLVISYGSDANISGSGYDAKADFNCDGVVDITDFGLLVNNYGAAGDM